MTVVLPVPPSARDYWRVWRNRAVRTKEAEAYCAAVRTLYRGRPHQRPVAVTMRWFRAAKRGDLDNRLKILLDALQGVAYANDQQVVELHAYRAEDPKRPRVEVEVRAAFPVKSSHDTLSVSASNGNEP